MIEIFSTAGAGATLRFGFGSKVSGSGPKQIDDGSHFTESLLRRQKVTELLYLWASDGPL